MSTGITQLPADEQAKEEESIKHENYLLRSLVALDQVANVMTGGLPDETISSRCARSAEHHQVLGELVSKLLDRLSKDHGAKAQAGDEARAEAVIAAEDESEVKTEP